MSNITKSFVAKAMSKFIEIHEFDDIPQEKLLYKDDITSSGIDVTYSVLINNDWTRYKKISLLTLEKNFTKIKIVIDNQTTSQTHGMYGFDNITTSTVIKPMMASTEDYFVGSSFLTGTFIIDTGESVSLLQINNNYMRNIMSPVKVKYFKTESDKDTADNVLHEYSLAKVVAESCCAIITKGNALPKDEESSNTEWGHEFASFEAYFSSKYFEELFGIDTRPIQGDYLAFVAVPRCYTVTSVTRIEGVNGLLYGYKMLLKHYEINSAVRDKPIDDIAISDRTNETIFFPNTDDKERLENRQENLPAYIQDDVERYHVSEDTTISTTPLGNYYSSKSDLTERESVIYNASVTSNTNFALSFMVSPIAVVPLKLDQKMFSIGGFQIRTSDTDVVEVYYNGMLYDTTMALDKTWNHVLVNVYNDSKQLEVIIVNDDTKIRTTSLHVLTAPITFNEDMLAILHNDNLLARIRLWKKTIPQEFERRILSSKLVEKPHMAYIQDDVKHILNTRTMMRSGVKGRNFGEIMNKIYSHLSDPYLDVILSRPKKSVVETSKLGKSLWLK